MRKVVPLRALEVEIDAAVLKRVQDGMRLLQVEYGPDWVEHIDLGRLDLGNADRCVLGQLFSDRGQEGEFPMDGFEWARENLGPLDGADVSVYGFDTQDESYTELQDAWVRVIEQMRRLEEVPV